MDSDKVIDDAVAFTIIAMIAVMLVFTLPHIVIKWLFYAVLGIWGISIVGLLAFIVYDLYICKSDHKEE